MYEIAHGIDVYYENKKEVRNIVFFAGKKYGYYQTGEMLFEVIGDESIYLLTNKVENMIKVFPDFDNALTKDGVVEGFKWLYGTVVDESLPVTTELFRSSFNEAIYNVLEQIEVKDSYKSIGDFFLSCYEKHLDHVQTFAVFVDAISSNTGGTADSFQKEIAQLFISSAEDLYKNYTRKCSVRHKLGYVSVETCQITNLLQLLTFEFCRMKKEGKVIKKCVNCERFFIPIGRNDSIYCHASSPQNPDKKCSEVGPQNKRNQKRQYDAREKEHHNLICKWYNAVRREKNKENDLEFIEHYKKLIDEEMIKYSAEHDKNKEQNL